MNVYRFSICGVGVQISSEQPIKLDYYSQKFLAGQASDISASIRLVDTLTVPQSAPIGGNSLRMVWRQGNEITRCCLHSENSPSILANYQISLPGIAECMIARNDWQGLSNMQQLWPGVLINYLLLPYRALIFHASYIQYQGKGILFTAPSQTGKSTQAELWKRYRGAEILNGDKAGVTLRGQPMAHGVPFSGTSGICRNVSSPLRAIVVLSQSPENIIRPLTPSQAVVALCPNVFVDSHVPEEWQMALGLLLDLVAAVPIYALACTPDERAVQALAITLGV